jgi:hypothetical protein
VFSASPVAVVVPLDERGERLVETVRFARFELDDPAEPDDPVAVLAVASGVAGVWAWKARTAAVPTTVDEMTIGARLMAGDSSKRE